MARMDHYDPGDHRPHGPRHRQVGGLFLARERGAFIIPHGCTEQDIACMMLSAVVKGHVSRGKEHGGKGMTGSKRRFTTDDTCPMCGNRLPSKGYRIAHANILLTTVCKMCDTLVYSKFGKCYVSKRIFEKGLKVLTKD